MIEARYDLGCGAARLDEEVPGHDVFSVLQATRLPTNEGRQRQ